MVVSPGFGGFGSSNPNRLQEGRLLVRSSGASFAALFPHLDALIGQAGFFATNGGGTGDKMEIAGWLLGFFWVTFFWMKI